MQHIECAQVNRGFNKDLAGNDKIYDQNLNTRINITFGSTDAAFNISRQNAVGIEKIIIHPDYWEDKTKHGNSYDIALVRTNKVHFMQPEILTLQTVCRTSTVGKVTF